MGTPCATPSTRAGRTFPWTRSPTPATTACTPLRAPSRLWRSARTGWASPSRDYFGKAMLALGIPMGTIKAWFEDPAVPFEGKRQSLFDLLEDLDGRDCLKKSVKILS